MLVQKTTLSHHFCPPDSATEVHLGGGGGGGVVSHFNSSLGTLSLWDCSIADTNLLLDIFMRSPSDT